MCGDCVEKPFPARGKMCLEDGCFMANFVRCSGCGANTIIAQNQRKEENEDEEELVELVQFEHTCVQCQHLVATHNYAFSVKDGVQEYSMECLLCGFAEDDRSVLPIDPQEYSLY